LFNIGPPSVDGAGEETQTGADRVSSSGILTAVNSIEEWWTSGERVPIRLGAVERAIFLRRMGSGPPMTMLHGYPSSSHDWAKVSPALAQRHSLLLPDFLGFGASEKPADHVYSLHEQADLIEALWALEETTSTVIVAYDYGLSVTQELLARRAEGALSVGIEAVHLLNGGLYPDLARPSRGQLAMLDPERGPQISAGITEERFVTALKPTFAAAFDAAADSTDIWRATAHQDGRAITHLLTRYIADRALHGERWVTALEQTDVPLAFLWGMLDPVSGAHMAQRIRERLPTAPFLELPDVGHWPPLETPERVAAALLAPKGLPKE
jgi:pimeloyl-ACP methyl ester carboxylesterase